MHVLKATVAAARVELSVSEVLLINNALNEVCNGIDVLEFSTRLGVTVEDAGALLRQIGDLYTHMQKH